MEIRKKKENNSFVIPAVTILLIIEPEFCSIKCFASDRLIFVSLPVSINVLFINLPFELIFFTSFILYFS